MQVKDIIEKMIAIKTNLNTKEKFSRDYYRILGGLEGMLVCIGKLPITGNLPYKDIEVEKKSLFGKKKLVKRKELYEELIIRLVDESIRDFT
jgi:hypothetical protein